MNDDSQQKRVDALIIERTNTVMNIGYQANLSAPERAAVIEEYRKALRDFPLWVVDRAFNAAAREIPRKPSPAELVALANRERKPITDELARREKAQAERDEYQREQQERRCSPDEAERLMQSHGFTAKRFGDIKKRPMANTWADVDAASDAADAPQHWSVGKADDSPEMVALRKARAENPLMRGSI